MTRRIAGIALIAIPLLFNAAFFGLGSAFEYPDILRQPTLDILQKFAAGGPDLVALWYVFAVSALLAIPLALLTSDLFRAEHPQMAQTAAIVGVLSGLVQAIGLFRWVFLVPGLAAQALDPALGPASQAAAITMFESAHRFFGVAIGEHLGYIFTGSWTILLSVMMFRSSLFNRWLGIIGLVSAVGILVGLLEPAGLGAAGAINAIAYIVWSLWLITMGVIALVRKA